MGTEKLEQLLEQIRAGKLSVADGMEQLSSIQVGTPIYANLDLDRARRCGFPEVILAEGKTPEWLEGVVARLIQANQDCFATRLTSEQARRLKNLYPEADLDEIARTFLKRANKNPTTPKGMVTFLTAGTGDIPVAREAMNTAIALGVGTKLIPDVGVAGLHRLLNNLSAIKDSDAIVVVAGMDGALPSVVGGLVDCPVIAVPTSIGYGTCFGGLSALLTMLNACSANVTAVNIDAGFKAGYVAALIARKSNKQ
jgi:NCAIR mutase (PurE)-related protein